MIMATSTRPSLKDCLAREYPFRVIADPDGGYVIEFPDLPGCMTQVEKLDEVGPMAAEIQQLWIETAYAEQMDIPLPSYPEEYSGKFVVRLPRSLHRRLAEGAERERISLNHWVVSILARGEAELRIERRLDELDRRLTEVQNQVRYHVRGVPTLRVPNTAVEDWPLEEVAA